MSAQAVNGAFTAKAAASEGNLDRPAVNGDHDAQLHPPSQNGHGMSMFERYAMERQKRLRAEGSKQFFKLANSEKFKHLAADPWVNKDNNTRLELHNGMHTKVFVVGGGFGGLCYGVRLVQAGIKPEDIVIADAAGGFGGTWYWNRYPGLMCDVESYVYLPLLEETGYMPKHKYSYGDEIRQYANMMAKKWNLKNRGAFRQQINRLDWQETDKCWQIHTTDLSTNESIYITAEFVCIAPGLLHQPKTSEFEGFEKYKGHSFHTARWDYDYTGGSQEDPSMVNLKGKKVGIIGTGASAVQIVPNLARFVDELYVFQRTPSSVDVRGQRPTDPEEWSKTITAKKNWQTERSYNFNSFLNHEEPLPEKNLVDDGWTKIKAYCALIGGPRTVTQEDVGDHVMKMHAWDAERSEMIRARAEKLVKDKDTANKLKAWYPIWCKRPCFHDDYLPAFNRPNVHLIDTDGKGIDHVTETGIVANGEHYDLDCIILGTGYSLEGAVSPTRRGGIDTYGRHGTLLDDKWDNQTATLHGVLTHDFPNLFFSGPGQATATANFAFVLDVLAQHCAYIVAQGIKTAGSDRVVIEPSVEAEEEWTMKIMMGAMVFAAVAGCTPGYLNGEGDADRMSQEQQMKTARMSMWSRGTRDYVRVLEEWRRDGTMQGLEVTAV